MKENALFLVSLGVWALHFLNSWLVADMKAAAYRRISYNAASDILHLCETKEEREARTQKILSEARKLDKIKFFWQIDWPRKKKTRFTHRCMD